MSDRLKRELDPPVGRIASPVPQYWNPDTGAYEKIHGKNGGANYVDAMEIRGLSSDVKPTTDVYVGTMFIEVDTGDVYVFMGGSTWTKKMEAIWD